MDGFLSSMAHSAGVGVTVLISVVAVSSVFQSTNTESDGVGCADHLSLHPYAHAYAHVG